MPGTRFLGGIRAYADKPRRKCLGILRVECRSECWMLADQRSGTNRTRKESCNRRQDQGSSLKGREKRSPVPHRWSPREINNGAGQANYSSAKSKREGRDGDGVEVDGALVSLLSAECARLTCTCLHHAFTARHKTGNSDPLGGQRHGRKARGGKKKGGRGGQVVK